MKTEEAKRIAMGLRTDFKCESDTMVDFCNTIIKALEQEPFINKPCVSSGVCEHDKNKVLDKIRAEIDHVTEIHSDGEFYIKNFDVKRIIDKYKYNTESEDKE